jgi:hypothetical protein
MYRPIWMLHKSRIIGHIFPALVNFMHILSYAVWCHIVPWWFYFNTLKRGIQYGLYQNSEISAQ